MAGAPERGPGPPHRTSLSADHDPGLSVEHGGADLLQRVVRDSPCGITAVGLDGTFLTANPAFCAQAGADPAVLPGSDGGSLAPDLVAAMRNAFASLQADDSETPGFDWVNTDDGSNRVVQYSSSLVRDRAGAPLFYVVIGNDVTEARQREDERRRLAEAQLNAEKLESLEWLAGGTANDFNNLLLAMMGQAELALMDLPPDHAAREALGDIVKVGFRAADLCKQLLAYCGKGDLRLVPLDLSELVQDLAPLLESRLGGLKLVLRLAADLPPVAGDATQLRQVVVDLAANAAMAMQDRPGIMELSTSLVELGRAEQSPVEFQDVVTGGDLAPGHYVRLEVRDSGPGLPEDQRVRIFDPFYTTAPVGRGLGLASVVGVVRSHRGALAVTSEVGQGTIVSIDLPPATRAAEEFLAANGHSHETPRLKPAHILVVDDEAPVRMVAARMLETAGHRVTTSADGYEALDLFGNDPDSFDLVLLDMTMPGISGLEALERIRQFRSALPVLLTSGFSESEVTDVLAVDRDCAFIHKPYGAVSLQRQVAAMLRRGGDEKSRE